MPNCWGYSQSFSFLDTLAFFSSNFSIFSLPPYPSKPSSISISCRAKVKWWEEHWNKVTSPIWQHQGKTCQSFWAGACLWLWDWVTTISGELKLLSREGKASERTVWKGPSWLDLISVCPINWQDCPASQLALGMGMRDWRDLEDITKRKYLRRRGPSTALLHSVYLVWHWWESWEEMSWWCVLKQAVRKFQRLMKWRAVGDSHELSWINSPSLALCSKEAKPVPSDNKSLELCWFIAGGISITALTTGGEREWRRRWREGEDDEEGRRAAPCPHHNMWVTSGTRGIVEREEQRLWERRKT